MATTRCGDEHDKKKRRMRAFKRWMKQQGIECSDALHLTIQEEEEEEGIISVKAVCDLKEGDVVARIPKKACLTIKTTAAKDLIESAGLEGPLGLAVTLMFEKSLGDLSPWASYLRLLSDSESLPLLWSLHDIDSLLRGTELHKTVKEDKALVYEDWRECILPLVASSSLKLNPKFFGAEQYFAARSLITSRSFEIDDYHGSGMVPLADLFNHKTGAEDVHFTSVSSHYESDSDDNECDNSGVNELLTENVHLRTNGLPSDAAEKNSHGANHLECSLTFADNPTPLEMIIVKDVKAGSEVFNTYGSLGNAALLHRYGFTEPDNPFDIVNIDLELVLQWSSSLFSSRYSRARLSLWRRLDYTGCISQSSEYFEISYDGQPQVELLILLYIMLLPEEAYRQLDLTVSTMGNFDLPLSLMLPAKNSITFGEISEKSKDLLLTKRVCDALLLLADIRERLYGSHSIEDDAEALQRCCRIKEKMLYHSLRLRLSERRILEKLRMYSAGGAQSFRTAKRASTRKKLKRT